MINHISCLFSLWIDQPTTTEALKTEHCLIAGFYCLHQFHKSLLFSVVSVLWKSGFMENCVFPLGTSNLTHSQHLQYDLLAVTICPLSPTHSPLHPKTNWTWKTSPLFQPITGIVCLHQIHTTSPHSMTMTVCLSGHQRDRPSSCDRCVAVVSAPELCVLRWAGQCSIMGWLDDREIRCTLTLEEIQFVVVSGLRQGMSDWCWCLAVGFKSII